MAKPRGKKASRSKAKRAKRAAPARSARPKAAAKKRAARKPATKAVRKRAAPKKALPSKAPARKAAAAPRRKPAAATVIPPDRSPGRGHHDMGGLPAGKVARTEHDYALWEKRVDAMMVLLSDRRRGLMNTDMLRRGIESLPPDAYDRMKYYERWIHSIATMMLERGVVTREELDARMARLRGAAK